jgi:hypothetical protein
MRSLPILSGGDPADTVSALRPENSLKPEITAIYNG